MARPYLEAVGLPGNALDDHSWQEDKAKADKVAKAVMTWAKEKGATMFTHWFQPLGSAAAGRPPAGIHRSTQSGPYWWPATWCTCTCMCV